MTRRRSDLVDGVLAVLIGVAIAAVTWKIGPEQPERTLPDALAYGCIAVASLGLAIRRRWPMTCLALVAGAVVVYLLREYAGGPIYLTPLLAVYSVAVAYERRRALTVIAGFTVGLILLSALVQVTAEGVAWSLIQVGWSAAAFLLGQAHRNRTEQQAALVERARYLEETREEEARRRVAEERLRLARDVHDVVAHSLASIAVQAGAGAHVIDRNPAEAKAALLAVKSASREALNELRATLDGLRSGGEVDRAPRRPAPGIDDVPALVDGVAVTGLHATLDVEGDAADLAPAADVAAYRIVQESLTNVLRHAGATTVAVSVHHGPDAVDIEVLDDGRGANGAPNGHGLAGMEERARGLGGTFEAGSAPGGGFRVRAHLPRVSDE